ncbi:MAG: alpha/beta hydrolase [Steroidobacteraceae bacterium]
MRRVFDEWRALGAKPVQGLSVVEARGQPGLLEAAASVLAKAERPPPASRVNVTREDLAYTGPGGSQLLRVYRPDNASPTSGVTLYLHGGGFVFGSVDRYENSAIGLARRSGALVASAAYRQAPEHRFPAAHEDAWAAWRWLTTHAAEFGGDPKKLAVTGEGSGANLAACVALRARDEGLPGPLHQVLIYPIAGTETNNYSYNAYGKAEPYGKARMEWIFRQIAADPKLLKDKRLNLGNNELKGLPRTTVITAEIDPVMFEGKLYGHKLDADGIPTRFQNFEGVVHDFFGMDALLPEARAAQTTAAEQLEAAFRNAARG